MQVNCDVLTEMTKNQPGTAPWEMGKANPGWLHHSVWDSQLPSIVQVLDQQTVGSIVKAYATLDAIPEMRLKTGSGVPYDFGGWIAAHIAKASEAFQEAEPNLRDFVARYNPWLALLPEWIQSKAAAFHRKRER